VNLLEKRAAFETTKRIYASSKLTFHGVEGFDVYNPSIPFSWKGRQYLFGRIERRGDWARSWARLFERSGEDDYTLVPDSMIYPLEDPYIAIIGDELVLGGTHVRNKQGKLDTYYGYFYRGTDLNDLVYFTTGPDEMKDIRLVGLQDGRVGVFSRPRNPEIIKKFGAESQIGFAVIDRLEDLTAEVIENAPYIPDLFAPGEWGGCNQAYLLPDGRIGVIGHMAFRTPQPESFPLLTYVNSAFVFDPRTHTAGKVEIIGTRPCYPTGPAKKPELVDCAFTAGLVLRADGRADLYSGIGDCEVGRIVIDNPFA
jgi:hypothetical protein